MEAVVVSEGYERAPTHEKVLRLQVRQREQRVHQVLFALA
jgi:hypothetical protein